MTVKSDMADAFVFLLVYTGIGSFTVVDEEVVNEEDIQRNFFLDASCIGSSKSKSTMQFLQELNMDVKANYEEKVRHSSRIQHMLCIAVDTPCSPRNIL